MRTAAMTWSSEQFVAAMRDAIISRRQDTVFLLCKVAVQRGDVVLGHEGDHDEQEVPLLVEACRAGQLPVVRCLCELPPALGVHHQTRHGDAVCEAAGSGHTDVVRYLCELPLERGVDPGAGDNCSVQFAALRGHLDVVRYLCELPLERGVEPGASDNDALRTSAANGHVDVVRCLCELPLERGVDPSVACSEAVRHAARNGHVDAVRYLCALPLERGVDPAALYNDALRASARNGHLDVVRYLCELPAERGVDTSAEDLTHAAMYGHLSIVRYLCELPASRGALAAARPKALCVAVLRAHTAVARYLCEELPLRQRVAPAVVHRAVTNVLARWRKRGWQPGTPKMLRYLVLELPGGDAWMDSAEASQWVQGQRSGASSPAMTWLVTAVARRRLWRRRRCLLLLRCMAHARRATHCGVYDAHQASPVSSRTSSGRCAATRVAASADEDAARGGRGRVKRRRR